MRKSEQLRQELAVLEAEEALVKAKGETKRCGECGRHRPRSKAQQAKVDAAKKQLAEVRRPLREAREAARAG